MINDIPPPAVGPGATKRHGTFESLHYQRPAAKFRLSDRLRRIKRNIGDRYAVLDDVGLR